MTELDKIKVLLGIKDDLQDDVLTIIIDDVRSHMLLLLKANAIPQPLEYIIREISVRRFNRLGSEGYKSESTDGHSINFYDLDKEFDPYLSIIDDFLDDSNKSLRKGSVLFL